jgi:hypothetical protein
MDIELVKSLMHSPVRNYAVPGVTSYLVKETDEYLFRAFHMERHQITTIVAHSHRFNLYSYVLQGRVMNTIWHPVDEVADDLDAFYKTELNYKNAFGKYDMLDVGLNYYKPSNHHYEAGDDYYMSSSDIHMISFEKNTLVLIREDKNSYIDKSYILEPVDKNLKRIPTFKVESWMFQGG